MGPRRGAGLTIKAENYWQVARRAASSGNAAIIGTFSSYYFSYCHCFKSSSAGAVLEKIFLVVALATQAKTTLQKPPPLYNCLLVLLLHTAAITKDLRGGKARVCGGIAPTPPQRKTVPDRRAIFDSDLTNIS